MFSRNIRSVTTRIAFVLVFIIAISSALPAQVTATANSLIYPPGSLDTTFDTDGKATTDFSGYGELASSIIIQQDGKLIVVGSGGNGTK